MADDDALRQRINRLGDKELLAMVGAKEGEYTDVALRMAECELSKRGVIVPPRPPHIDAAQVGEGVERLPTAARRVAGNVVTGVGIFLLFSGIAGILGGGLPLVGLVIEVVFPKAGTLHSAVTLIELEAKTIRCRGEADHILVLPGETARWRLKGPSTLEGLWASPQGLSLSLREKGAAGRQLQAVLIPPRERSWGTTMTVRKSYGEGRPVRRELFWEGDLGQLPLTAIRHGEPLEVHIEGRVAYPTLPSYSYDPSRGMVAPPPEHFSSDEMVIDLSGELVLVDPAEAQRRAGENRRLLLSRARPSLTWLALGVAAFVASFIVGQFGRPLE